MEFLLHAPHLVFTLRLNHAPKGNALCHSWLSQPSFPPPCQRIILFLQSQVLPMLSGWIRKLTLLVFQSAEGGGGGGGGVGVPLPKVRALADSLALGAAWTWRTFCQSALICFSVSEGSLALPSLLFFAHANSWREACPNFYNDLTTGSPSYTG